MGGASVTLPAPRLPTYFAPFDTTAQPLECQVFARHLSSLPRLIDLVSNFCSPLGKLVQS